MLIPGATFRVGTDVATPDVSPNSPFSTEREHPSRLVRVGSFWIQEHEVTNEEYRRFDATHAFPEGHERYPVVEVTWEEAQAYARSLGGSLPTETQWELAARGPQSRIYPWGNRAPTCEQAHFGGCEPEGPIPVMSLPEGATPEGVYDLAGNVREWVAPIGFDPEHSVVNRRSRRTRGGGFNADTFFLHPSHRNEPLLAGFKDDGTGFRVAWPLR